MDDEGKHSDHGFMHAFGKSLQMSTIDKLKWINNANEKAGKKMLLGFAKSRFSIHCECYAFRGNYQGSEEGPGMPLNLLTRDQLGKRLKEWIRKEGNEAPAAADDG